MRLAAFVLTSLLFLFLALPGRAQDVPAEIAPILAWDIESAYQSDSGMGHVVFVKVDSAVTPVRVDSLHAYYGVSGERTAWEANLNGVRYVFSKAWGLYVLDDEAAEGVQSYRVLMDRYGDATMNGVPDIIDALEHVQMIKQAVSQ